MFLKLFLTVLSFQYLFESVFNSIEVGLKNLLRKRYSAKEKFETITSVDGFVNSKKL